MSGPDSLAAAGEVEVAIEAERARQESFAELIASENYVSRQVLAAQGSVLTNKYADGYPGRRMYRGCEFVDTVETLARERACSVFGAAHANVQPYSGTQANVAAYAALIRPGDRILGMRADHGGHITHGADASFSGTIYEAVHFGLEPGTCLIDYEAVRSLARSQGPALIVAGCSAYARAVDWASLREIADEAGARLVADMAHVAGLVAARAHPDPVPLADIVTSTTHKTLRGPRGGLILTRDAGLARRIDEAVYPYAQGGPLMHVVAAKAVAFGEAMQPAFARYIGQVLANARILAAGLAARGLQVVTGGTDNHMVLIDLAPLAMDARAAEAALEAAHIAVNAIGLPGDAGAGAASGLRVGTAAVTTRGFGPDEMAVLADAIADVLEGRGHVDSVRRRVEALCRRYPVYPRPGCEGD